MNVGDLVVTKNGHGVVCDVGNDGINYVIILCDTGENVRINVPSAKPKRSVHVRVAAVTTHHSEKHLFQREDLPPFCDGTVLGFLATKSFLYIEGKEKSKKRLMNKYDQASDHAPWDDTHFKIYGNKWGNECRIMFTCPMDMIDKLGLGEFVYGQDNHFIISFNALWWELIRIGFRLGKEHDVVTIREALPESERDKFDAALLAA